MPTHSRRQLLSIRSALCLILISTSEGLLSARLAAAMRMEPLNALWKVTRRVRTWICHLIPKTRSPSSDLPMLLRRSDQEGRAGSWCDQEKADHLKKKPHPCEGTQVRPG